MFGGHGPVALLDDSIDTLIQQLANIKEGTEEGFHQGRVAIRRIREALAVARDDYDVISRISPMPGGTYLAKLSNGQELAVSRIQSRVLRETLLKL